MRRLSRPGFRAASFLVRKAAIVPKHDDAEVKARAVRLVSEQKVESGSVTKSCEAVGATAWDQQAERSGPTGCDER
jgi:hypothetical protein